MAKVKDYFADELRREKARAKRKIIYALLMLAAVYVVAINIFHYTEQWDWLDSVYFTTATITTVGYGDVVPQTELGKMVTIPLMLVGIGVGFYVILPSRNMAGLAWTPLPGMWISILGQKRASS